MHGGTVCVRPSEHPEVAYLPMMSLVHYGLRHSPPLATPVRGRRGALVLAVSQNGSYSSCYQSVIFKQLYADTRVLENAQQRDYFKRLLESVRGELLKGASVTEALQKMGAIVKSGTKGNEDQLFSFSRADQAKLNTFGKEFIDALFRLKKGETSPVLESRIGMHIVQVIDKVPPQLLGLTSKIPPEYEMTVQQFIAKTMRTMKSTEMMLKAQTEIVNELRKEAQTVIYEGNL